MYFDDALDSVSQMKKKEQAYTGKACPVCGAGTRRAYETGGTKGRQQHPRWWVCARGHKLYRKTS